MRRALLLALLVLAGCGGEPENAGLTRDQVEPRAAQAVSTAQQNGSLATALNRAITPDADGAMGQAGGSAPGITRVDVETDKPSVALRVSESGEIWVVAYDMRRAPIGLHVCAYVSSDTSRVTVKREC